MSGIYVVMPDEEDFLSGRMNRNTMMTSVAPLVGGAEVRTSRENPVSELRASNEFE